MTAQTTFSKDIIKKSNKTATITDDLGRVIVIKKPRYSTHLELIKAVGAELAKNDAYLNHVALIATVVSIDGQPMPLNALVDIEYLLKVLEESDDAIAKISSALVESFSEKMNDQEHKDALKK